MPAGPRLVQSPRVVSCHPGTIDRGGIKLKHVAHLSSASSDREDASGRSFTASFTLDIASPTFTGSPMSYRPPAMHHLVCTQRIRLPAIAGRQLLSGSKASTLTAGNGRRKACTMSLQQLQAAKCSASGTKRHPTPPRPISSVVEGFLTYRRNDLQLAAGGML